MALKNIGKLARLICLVQMSMSVFVDPLGKQILAVNHEDVVTSTTDRVVA